MNRFSASVGNLPPLSLSPKRVPEHEQISVHQSMRDLSVTRSQLRLLMQALTNITQEKKTLVDVTGRLKKRKMEVSTECSNLKKNHDRLHNETVRLQKAHDKFESDRVTMEKELEFLETEAKMQDAAAAREKLEIMETKALLNEETVAVQKLSDMVAKLKREISVQTRQREAVKGETTGLDRQIEQLREKILRLRSSNQNVMRQIKQTAYNIGEVR